MISFVDSHNDIDTLEFEVVFPPVLVPVIKINNIWHKLALPQFFDRPDNAWYCMRVNIHIWS